VWLEPDAATVAAQGLSPRTIEMLMSVAANAPLDADPSSPASCPTCGGTLSRTGLNGIVVEHCPEHGTFFDRGTLVRVSGARSAAANAARPLPGAPAGFAAPPPMSAMPSDQLPLAERAFHAPARTSGTAIAGLVFAFLCPIIGLVIAWKAQREIEMSGGRLKGQGLATAGIVISILNMVVGILMRLRS
jgi:hypothetical protein